jgi:hypothetical protein
MPDSMFRKGKRHPHFGHKGHKHGKHGHGGHGGAPVSEGSPSLPPNTIPSPTAGNAPGVAFLPPIDAFYSQTMDVYSGTGTFNPPPGGSKRTSNVNILIAGNPLEGARSRIQTGFGYTHVILCDPAIEIRDNYTVNTTTIDITKPDCLAIPTAQTANLWIVIMQAVAVLPKVGKKKILLCDRHVGGTGGVANWPTMI